ncbi:MAG TPA: hypothetical protein VKT52_03585 [Ktedonobacterales bacterium]|nr:hypothetical protein [Ktedonobacterales bacterium]
MTDHNNTHYTNGDDDDELGGEDFDPREYDMMLELERLESLEEDMTDLGVTTLEEVRQRIADLHKQLDAEE